MDSQLLTKIEAQFKELGISSQRILNKQSTQSALNLIAYKNTGVSMFDARLVNQFWQRPTDKLTLKQLLQTISKRLSFFNKEIQSFNKQLRQKTIEPKLQRDDLRWYIQEQVGCWNDYSTIYTLFGLENMSETTKSSLKKMDVFYTIVDLYNNTRTIQKNHESEILNLKKQNQRLTDELNRYKMLHQKQQIHKNQQLLTTCTMPTLNSNSKSKSSDFQPDISLQRKGSQKKQNKKKSKKQKETKTTHKTLTKQKNKIPQQKKQTKQKKEEQQQQSSKISFKLNDNSYQISVKSNISQRQDINSVLRSLINARNKPSSQLVLGQEFDCSSKQEITKGQEMHFQKIFKIRIQVRHMSQHHPVTLGLSSTEYINPQKQTHNGSVVCFSSAGDINFKGKQLSFSGIIINNIITIFADKQKRTVQFRKNNKQFAKFTDVELLLAEKVFFFAMLQPDNQLIITDYSYIAQIDENKEKQNYRVQQQQ